MLIDWFTVGAQVLNFLILVWLMRRFLYQPILHAIDAREQRVAAELADAAAKQAEAQQERDDFRSKKRAARLKEVADEVKVERQRLLDEAVQAAEAISTKRRQALADEARSLDQAVGRWARDEVFAIARRTLTDLAGANLEERVAEVLVRRLREIDGQTKASLADALKKATAPAVVRSAFDLPVPQRKAIQEALDETFATDVSLRFETAPDLISGIEFTTNGQKVAWSIADYLASMENGVGDLLARETRQEPAANPEPPHPPKQEHTAEPRSKTRRKAAPKAVSESS